MCGLALLNILNPYPKLKVGTQATSILLHSVIMFDGRLQSGVLSNQLPVCQQKAFVLKHS